MALVGVNFHRVDWHDWVSVLIFLIGSVLGLNMRYVHVSLTIRSGGVDRSYDFTSAGLFTSRGTGSGRPIDNCVYFAISEVDALKMLKRIHECSECRLSVCDLFRIAFRLKPIGYTCTTFAQYVLGKNDLSPVPNTFLIQLLNH